MARASSMDGIWQRIMAIGSILVDNSVGVDIAALSAQQQAVLRKMKGAKINAKAPIHYTVVAEGGARRIKILNWEDLELDRSSPVSWQELQALVGVGMPLAADVTQSVGGAANNVARGSVRFGKSPSIFSGIGDDEPGQMIIRSAQEAGVDAGGILKKADMNTGESLIIRYEGDRLILTYRGAATLKQSDIPAGFPGEFAPDGVVLCNCNDTRTSLLVLAKLAGKGINKLWIPSKKDMQALEKYFDEENPEQGELFVELVQDMFRRLGDSDISLMCLNKEEWTYAKPDVQNALKDAFKTIAITNGTEGGEVYYRDEKGMHHETYKALVVPKEAFVDSTGAGDSFSLTLFLSLNLYKGDIRKAIDAAKCVSASIVRYADPVSGYGDFRTVETLDQFVRASLVRTD